MEEEFKKLVNLLSQTYEGKPVKLEDILIEALALFDGLKTKLKNANGEEKQAMVRSLNEMYTKLASQAKQFSEKTGLSEEQLYAASENPENYTPEQWRSMQEAKNKLLESSRQISKTIQSSSAPQPSHSQLVDSKRGPHVKKDKWVRS